MKVTITEEPGGGGLFGGKKYIWVKTTVIFTEEETAVIRKNLMTLRCDAHDTEFNRKNGYTPTTLGSLMKSFPTGAHAHCDSPIEAMNVREGIKKFLAEVKAGIERFSSKTKDESFEL